MQFDIEQEIDKDFSRWAQLIDWAAHAENEVEAAQPAARAAALAKKWVSLAPTKWDALRAQYTRKIYPDRRELRGAHTTAGRDRFVVG